MDLPQGTRIYPNDISIRMAKETGKKVAEELLSALNLQNNNMPSQIIIPVNLDGREIARVTAPYLDRENGRKITLTGRMRGNV